MSAFSPTDTIRHEYLLAAWKRALYFLLGVLLTAGGLFFCFARGAGSDRLASQVSTVFFLVGGAYMVAFALRSRLVIEGSHIEVRGAFREQAADLDDIEGFRTIRSRNGTYTRLCLKEDRGAITMPRSFDTDEAFRKWFQQLPDLDKRDRDSLLDEIARQNELGATPNERIGALRYAKTWSILILIVSVIAAVALNLGDKDMLLPAAVALAFMPVVALFLVWRSPLLYAVFKPRADPRAELSFILMAAGFGLLIRDSGVHLVSQHSLLWLIGLITIAFTVGFLGSIRSGSVVWGRLIGLFFFVGLYSYALVVLANTLPDHSRATPYTTSVIGKRISHGRSASYILDLAPWGPVQNPNPLTVSSTLYNETLLGDQVCLNLYPGLLLSPWYRQVPCTAQPVPDVQQ